MLPPAALVPSMRLGAYHSLEAAVSGFGSNIGARPEWRSAIANHCLPMQKSRHKTAACDAHTHTHYSAAANIAKPNMARSVAIRTLGTKAGVQLFAPQDGISCGSFSWMLLLVPLLDAIGSEGKIGSVTWSRWRGIQAVSESKDVVR
eukprot:768383-Amphidinium_carterae.1